jgi:carbon monoxide dehydrogenase subunit G
LERPERIIADAPLPNPMPNTQTTPRAPWSVRRARGGLARVGWWRGTGIAAIAFAAAAGAAGPPPARIDIDLHQSGRTFVVDATFSVPVPPAVAWDVLTDFEHMDAFVPNLADSRIVARDGNRLTILQHGTARFGLFAMRFESERLVTLAPPSTIRSTQVRGSMEKLDSVTTFVPEGRGTRLAYRVEAIPGALYPDFITRHFLRHEIAEQFDAIAREMVRRNAAADAPARPGNLAIPAPVADAVAARARGPAPRPAGPTIRAARPVSASAPPG